MNYLWDTDIASFSIRGVYGLSQDVVIKHAGQICIAWPTETELLVWAYNYPYPFRRLSLLRDFRRNVPVVPLSYAIQERYAKTMVLMLRNGTPMQAFDLLIAATALAHKLTLVTHNVKHFRPVPGLRVQDWTEAGA